MSASAIIYDEVTAASFAVACRIAALADPAAHAHLTGVKTAEVVALAPGAIFNYRQENADRGVIWYRGWIVAGRRGGRTYRYSHMPVEAR